MSLIALLTGVYHLSRRKTVTLLSDIVGVCISLGGVSNVEARVSDAVKPAVVQAWKHVDQASAKHTDATGWLTTGVTYSLWTIATTMATVFKILVDGKTETIKPLFGALKGILISDRATVFGFWAMKRRQICWAHLLRKFVSFSERDGPAKAIGDELLNLTGILFEYWHDYKDGKLSRRIFVAWMAPVRAQLEEVLERAVAADITRLSGSCADMLAHKHALWTFVDRDGIEPTNNHAERELRAFVLWRKRCFGAQSDRGNLFAERLMTIAHTARKQNQNVLAFLTGCCEAHMTGSAAPSLFDVPVAKAA
jgi:transposase